MFPQLKEEMRSCSWLFQWSFLVSWCRWFSNSAGFCSPRCILFSVAGNESQCIYWFTGGHHRWTLSCNLPSIHTAPIQISSQANNSSRVNDLLSGRPAWSGGLPAYSTIWLRGSIPNGRAKKGIFASSLPGLLPVTVIVYCPGLYKDDLSIMERPRRKLSKQRSVRGPQKQ